MRSHRDIQVELEQKVVFEFPTFVKKVLKRTVCAFLFIPFYILGERYDSFQREGLQIMPQIYVVTFDSSSVRSRNQETFPRNSTLFALIDHLPGSMEFRNKIFGTIFNVVHYTNTVPAFLICSMSCTRSDVR